MRAVAVLLVLAFHFFPFNSENAGFLGVDIFFVISGFLITTIVERQLDARSFSLSTFYSSRIRRLAPSLFVVLTLTVVAGLLFLFPNDLVELSKQVLVSQFYVANFYYWRNINYFGLGIHDAYLLHTWSLAVEEQFYLIYPATLIILHRFARKFFWPAIALGFVISFGLNIFLVSKKPELTFYLLPTRAWELLAGALVSIAAFHWRRGQLLNEVIGFLGAIFIVSAVAFYQADYPFPGFYALLPVIGAACLLLSGQGNSTLVSSALSWPPIVYIGRISYSLYLVHWPINVFAGQLIENYSTLWRLAMFALSICIASVIYFSLEAPIHYRRFLKGRILLFGYFAGLAATVTLFLSRKFRVVCRSAFRKRLPPWRPL